MAIKLTEQQIDDALWTADVRLASAGHASHISQHEADMREALRGNISFEEVVLRGVERLRARNLPPDLVVADPSVLDDFEYEHTLPQERVA